MPKFELIPIEEALEATKETRWLDEKFGVEYEMGFDERGFFDVYFLIYASIRSNGKVRE